VIANIAHPSAQQLHSEPLYVCTRARRKAQLQTRARAADAASLLSISSLLTRPYVRMYVYIYAFGMCWSESNIPHEQNRAALNTSNLCAPRACMCGCKHNWNLQARVIEGWIDR